MESREQCEGFASHASTVWGEVALSMEAHVIVSTQCTGLFRFVWLVIFVALLPAFSQAESPAVARINGPHGAIEITQERLVRYAETRSGVAVEQLPSTLLNLRD